VRAADAQACNPQVDYEEEIWGSQSAVIDCVAAPSVCAGDVTCSCIMAALGVASNADWFCSVQGGFVFVSSEPP
jgi:hypothetical protein